ncbi:hypothetical protein [Conexibacter sp. SYSU D00693]|uniref:hypothetical protein n=1 Tax=Conexibacter sp. SYSU D00693 TaxID=2812560 RepID=UPI00196AF597|nr:hypothetical protein [Conexibacter sp. SYSU D00693]
MEHDGPGRATPGGESPSADRPLAPGEGDRSPSPRDPGDSGELGFFTADEEATHDERTAQEGARRDEAGQP